MPNQINLIWQAPEFKHYQKNYAWYVTLAAISILIVGYFVIQKDLFAAICLAIIAAFVFFFSRQVPQKVEVEINIRHIRFGNLVFPYQQIKHFWIVNNEHHRTLNVHTTAVLNNVLIIELEDQDPEEIRDFLIRLVPEHTETGETFPQKVMHKLKF